MRFGQNSLDEISVMLAEQELRYTDTVMIGDNSSGKSLLLKQLIQKMQDRRQEVYFIDAVNRSFDVKDVQREKRKPAYKPTILSTRLQENYFNLADSFSCYGTSTERIEEVYSAYEEEVQALFCELTNERFEMLRYGDELREVAFIGGVGLLSSGYQALIRLLLELLYYREMGMEQRRVPNAYVVIDELDEFLSPRYAGKIWGFLKEKFPEINWVVTTHSCDLVACAKDANLIVLEAGRYEVMDVNDYASLSEVQLVFGRLFGERKEPVSQTEEQLRRLFNNKISGIWTTEDEEQLQQLGHRPLSASQQVIYRQIKEW